jgi:hypothetical protein
MNDLKQINMLINISMENNYITAVPSMCQVLRFLGNFEKIESINFRNNNFSNEIV